MLVKPWLQTQLALGQVSYRELYATTNRLQLLCGKSLQDVADAVGYFLKSGSLFNGGDEASRKRKAGGQYFPFAGYHKYIFPQLLETFEGEI